jgi:tetratricopeptide (TPR) repeat protein
MTNHEKCEAAWIHLSCGRFQEAEQLFTEVLSRDARYARALHGMGRLARCTQRPDLALDMLLRAAQADPQSHETQFDLANEYSRRGRSDEAIRALRAAIALRADIGRHHSMLGTLLGMRGQLAAAKDSLLRAVDLIPDDANAHLNLAVTLLNLDDFAGAEVHARRAIDLNPNLARAHANLAAVAEFKGDLPAMLAANQAAVALEPDNPDLHFALAQSLLMTGNYIAGWREYEWRFKTKLDPIEAPKFSTPPWDGRDIAGKTLLVHTEQGLGDSIQFARFLPTLATRGIRVVLRCQPPLGALMRTVKGVAEVATGKEALPSFEEHVPLLGSPHRLGTTSESIPRDVPYVSADEAKVFAWNQRLSSKTGLRIGVCWAGNPEQPRDRYRSMNPKFLAQLGDLPNIEWFSLQKNWRGPKPPLPLHDHTQHLHDFSDTAALMMHLDLVLSVDTSVCHLAGALARPVWTMLYYLGDYRYVRGRTDSNWYPTMRIFRQPAPNDWPSVMAQVRDAVSSHPKYMPRSCPP